MRTYPFVTPDGLAKPGDVVMGAHGEYYEIVSVTNADDYLKGYYAKQPIGVLKGSAAGRCALYGGKKQGE